MDKQVTAIVDEQTERILKNLSNELENMLDPLNDIASIKRSLSGMEEAIKHIQNDLTEIKNKLK